MSDRLWSNGGITVTRTYRNGAVVEIDIAPPGRVTLDAGSIGDLIIALTEWADDANKERAQPHLRRLPPTCSWDDETYLPAGKK